MTDGRKTTYKERIEIVSLCIANSNDYSVTSNKYNVSYQQVFILRQRNTIKIDMKR